MLPRIGSRLVGGARPSSLRGLEATGVCPAPALGDGRLYAMSLSTGDSKPTTFAEWCLPKDTDGDSRLSKAEAPANFVEPGGFDLTDLNKDGFITEQEWTEFMARIRRGEHGLFALRAPGGTPLGLRRGQAALKSNPSRVLGDNADDGAALFRALHEARRLRAWPV